jgi:hypothetical protein
VANISEESTVNENKRFCLCGCGREVTGWNKNLRQPIRYIHGHQNIGQNCNFWNGGRTKISTGYYLIKLRNHPYADTRGYVMEHRIVMEKYLGRYLDPKESVHHINGIKTDNRIENLQLFPNMKEHTSFEKKGVRFTDQHKQNIAEAQRGKSKPYMKGNKLRLGKTSWNKGKKTGLITTGAFKNGHIPWNKKKA